MAQAKHLKIEWEHFLSCIDFNRSNLDAQAIRFMNEFPGDAKCENMEVKVTVTEMGGRETKIGRHDIMPEAATGGYIIHADLLGKGIVAGVTFTIQPKGFDDGDDDEKDDAKKGQENDGQKEVTTGGDKSRTGRA